MNDLSAKLPDFTSALESCVPYLLGCSDSATRGCEVGNPSVVMDLDVEEKAREIRLRFCGAISGQEAYRYAPERLGQAEA